MNKNIQMWKDLFRGQNWKVILVMTVLTGIACSPIYYHRIAVPVDTDYGTHIAITQDMLKGEGLNPNHLSHPVLQLILAAMFLGSRGRLGLYGSLIILQVLVQILIVLILYFWFGKAERKYWDWIRAGAAVTLTFVAPIMLMAFQDALFLNGYIGLADYHNPTIHLLKPFALLSFIYAIKSVSGERSPWKGILLAAGLTVFSSWIKPNYLMSILPALALAVVIRWWQHRRVDWKLLAYGFFLPGLLTLLIQWLIAYYFGDPGEGIILAPFVVVGAYSKDLLLKFLLSILFPLVVLIIARKKVLTESSLLISWIGFIAGAAQYYLLAEGGERMLHQNFVWSAQIMLFLLFAAAARWVLREKWLPGGMSLGEKISTYSTYLLHLAAGIVYYIYCMLSVHYW